MIKQFFATISSFALAFSFAGMSFATVANAHVCETLNTQIVSDTTNMVVGDGNAIAAVVHSAWTASIPGATWIWKTSATANIESGLDTNEYIAMDVSFNGGSTWTEKARLRGNVDAEGVWRSESTEVNGISNLRIRFRGRMSHSSEDANVDNVQVVAF